LLCGLKIISYSFAGSAWLSIQHIDFEVEKIILHFTLSFLYLIIGI
jgi:hypothetical protein